MTTIRAPLNMGMVFLSYAHEDSDVAAMMADALRAAGVSVWLDAGELRGGDAWDQKIRRQIKDCSLFIAVVSANTQARSEGYFRREWNLAVDRTHDMSASRAFLVPVLVDDLAESTADVPEQFLKVHCTRLPGGRTTPEFVAHIRQLLAGPRAVEAGAGVAGNALPAPRRTAGLRVWAAVLVGMVVLVAAGIFFLSRSGGAPATAIAANQPARTAPVAAGRSIAVLPFVDLSEGKDQEYMSDGLAEELLNLLAKIPALQVTSRTSAFSFKGKNVAIPEIARRLNVSHVLEGSVRKAGNRLRITAQLIDARTDTHLWSETYDRSPNDIFAVQDEIAAAVVAQLKVTLMAGVPRAKEADPGAYALYLKARKLARQGTAKGIEQALATYRQALAVDPSYADAWVGLAVEHLALANKGLRPIAESYRLAREALDKALAIDPNSAAAYLTLSRIASDYDGDMAAAARSIERAVALDPTSVAAVAAASSLAQGLGRLDLATALDQYTVARDPMNPASHGSLAYDFARTGRLDEGIASYRTALALSPGRVGTQYNIGELLLRKGDAAGALAAMREEPEENWRLMGIAMAQYSLGKQAESDAALALLIRKYEKESAYNIAYVMAHRREAARAFEWLDKAVAYHDTGLVEIPGEPFFANLRNDPRWDPFVRKVGKAPEQLAAIRLDVKLP